jgi:carbonic anhydrase/acetyltransferase-like protein (isoleucine patch superfamily)
MIGMNAVIMDDVEIGAECIIGALTFVPAGMTIEPRKVVVGNPAKVMKDVTDEMLRWKTEGTKLYQSLPGMMRESWREAEPLREVPASRPGQAAHYRTWRDTRQD